MVAISIRSPVTTLLLSAGLAVAASFPTSAEPLTFSVDLRTGIGDPPAPPYITYRSTPQDSNSDGWYETVLRINLNGSPYNQAQFQVHYTAPPGGTCCNVNIGDSITNNGGSGDAATQSNDAELHVDGATPGFVGDLRIFGRDGTPIPLLEDVPSFAADGVTATFTVANDFVAWDNGRGESGSLISPWLFALAGQPDTEGPVNYDIFAAFNRVIDGPYRLGTGVGEVTVTLSNTTSKPVFEPSSIILLAAGLVGVGLVKARRSKSDIIN